MTILRGVVHGALLVIGFYTHAVLYPYSDGTKQELMVEMESLKDSLAKAESLTELIRANITSLEESVMVKFQKVEEKLEDFDRVLWQLVEKDRKKLSGVSYEEMNQKKRSDLVQRMKAEYGIFKNYK